MQAIKRGIQLFILGFVVAVVVAEVAHPSQRNVFQDVSSVKVDAGLDQVHYFYADELGLKKVLEIKLNGKTNGKAHLWHIIRGPSYGAYIKDDRKLQTTLQVRLWGTYILQLIAVDGGGKIVNADEVQIEVKLK